VGISRGTGRHRRRRMIGAGLTLPALGVVVYLNVWLVIVIAASVGAAVGALNGLLISRSRWRRSLRHSGRCTWRGARRYSSRTERRFRICWQGGVGQYGVPVVGFRHCADDSRPHLADGGAWGNWSIRRNANSIRPADLRIGGNERAAELSGVRVGRVKLSAYMISGFCAAMVGLVIASQLVAAHPATGETFELNAIAAVVLGGTSLMGGRGSVGGSIAGAFVIGVLADGLVLLGLSQFWQIVIKGVVIVVAVLLDQMQKRFSWREKSSDTTDALLFSAACRQAGSGKKSIAVITPCTITVLQGGVGRRRGSGPCAGLQRDHEHA